MLLKSPLICAILAILISIPMGIKAQDLKSFIKKLSPEEKLQALAYMRQAGASIDKELEDTYQQLSPDARAKTLTYLQAIQPEKEGKPIRTTVRWSRDTIQFGVLEEGTVYIDSVTVTNTGTRPYSITGNQTSCDCTVLSVPEQVILPGESATVRFEFNSLGKSGNISTAIIIQDNSKPNARSMLFLKGSVKPRKAAKKKPWE